ALGDFGLQRLGQFRVCLGQSLDLGLLGSSLLLQASLFRRFGLEPFAEILISLRELLDQIVGACRLGFEFAGALLKPRNLILGRRGPAHERRDAGVYVSELIFQAVCLGGRLLLIAFERRSALSCALARLLKR